MIEVFDIWGHERGAVNAAYIIHAEPHKNVETFSKIIVDLDQKYGSCAHDQPRQTEFWLKIPYEELLRRLK